MCGWLQPQLTEWLILTSLSVTFQITHVTFQRNFFPPQCFAPFLRRFTFIFYLQRYYRTLRNWTLLFRSAVYILLIIEVFFLLLLHCYFFLSQLSPAVIVKVIFSSFASLHLYPYFRIFVFFNLLCKNAFVSVMPLHLFSRLFSQSSIVIVQFVSVCPFFRVSFFEVTFFYRVCSSLIPALFVSSSSSSFSTDVIVLFISSSAFIFFLLIRCFFCCVMWHFHSLYTFFCSALITPLLSCHHFSVMSPRLLPPLSCCVILRSHKQIFPPRLPCTDLSEWSQETITSRATRVLALSDHQRSWRHALIVLDKTMELLVLRYTLSHVVGSSSIVEVGAQRLRSYRVQ